MRRFLILLLLAGCAHQGVSPERQIVSTPTGEWTTDDVPVKIKVDASACREWNEGELAFAFEAADKGPGQVQLHHKFEFTKQQPVASERVVFLHHTRRTDERIWVCPYLSDMAYLDASMCYASFTPLTAKSVSEISVKIESDQCSVVDRDPDHGMIWCE